MITEARHYKILNAVKDAITALITANSLPGILAANVKVVLLPLVDRLVKEGKITLPAIVISPTDLSETINSNPFNGRGTNLHDDYGYPCTVAILDSAEAANLTTDLNLYLIWRETLIKAFHNKRLTVGSDHLIAAVEPKNIVSLNAWAGSGLFASGFVVRPVSRELRS